LAILARPERSSRAVRERVGSAVACRDDARIEAFDRISHSATIAQGDLLVVNKRICDATSGPGTRHRARSETAALGAAAGAVNRRVVTCGRHSSP
jgi:hypothetical protein